MDKSDLQKIQAAIASEVGMKEELKAAIQAIDSLNRTIAANLNASHSIKTNLNDLASQSMPLFALLKSAIAQLASLIKPNQYYRVNSLFSQSIQASCFNCAFLKYLESEDKLITVAELEHLLGQEVSFIGNGEKFHIPIEDFLHGLISLANVLSRLAVNSVTKGDFKRPVRILKFVGDIHEGFQLLNLKNDSLRKRFDSIKYDVKKIEEVVYDLKLRGLLEN